MNMTTVDKPFEISKAVLKENVTALIASDKLTYPYILIEGTVYKTQGVLIRDLIEESPTGIPLCINLKGHLVRLKTINPDIYNVYKLCLLLNRDLKLVLSDSEFIAINQQVMLENGVLDLTYFVNKQNDEFKEYDNILKELLYEAGLYDKGYNSFQEESNRAHFKIFL